MVVPTVHAMSSVDTISLETTSALVPSSSFSLRVTTVTLDT